MPTVDVRSEIVVDRPVATVAAFAADPDNAPRWYDNIESIEWRTSPPLQVGSVVGFVARFLGRRLEYDYEIVEHDPGRRLVMRTNQGPFPMETTYTWEELGAGTRMALRNRGTPSGFSKLAAVAMVPAMRRANRKDRARLGEILEGR